MHDISIKKVNRGFVVTVGCQTFVFEDAQYMFQCIQEYWKDPAAAEKKFVTMPRNDPSDRPQVRDEGMEEIMRHHVESSPLNTGKSNYLTDMWQQHERLMRRSE